VLRPLPEVSAAPIATRGFIPIAAMVKPADSRR